MIRFQTLNKAELERVSRDQAAQQRSWRALPPEGVTVDCLGKKFTVLPNVFPPKNDSRLLIDSMDIGPGTAVLDLGTGTGVLAIFAVLGGAKAAVAVDINPDAVRNAELNAERHTLQEALEVRLSDGFSAIAASEKFDLIIANLPGRNETAEDVVAAAQWDTGFRTHESFFAQAPDHLKPGGKILMVKANYPELNDVVELADRHGFGATILAREDPAKGDPRTYYALAFSR